MKLYVKRTNKSVKTNKDGDEITTYSCLLKGSDENNAIKVNLVLISENLPTLNALVPQNVGESRNLKLELVS